MIAVIAFLFLLCVSAVRHIEIGLITSSKEIGKKCAEHPGCIGIQGDCCPTVEGVWKECCGQPDDSNLVLFDARAEGQVWTDWIRDLIPYQALQFDPQSSCLASIKYIADNFNSLPGWIMFMRARVDSPRTIGGNSIELLDCLNKPAADFPKLVCLDRMCAEPFRPGKQLSQLLTSYDLSGDVECACGQLLVHRDVIKSIPLSIWNQIQLVSSQETVSDSEYCGEDPPQSLLGHILSLQAHKTQSIYSKMQGRFLQRSVWCEALVSPYVSAARPVLLDGLLEFWQGKKPEDIRDLEVNFVPMAADSLPPASKTMIVLPYRQGSDAWKIALTQATESISSRMKDLASKRADGWMWKIVVIESPLGPDPFNKGLLLNVGIKEALTWDADVVVMHDVDCIPDASLSQYYDRIPPNQTDYIKLTFANDGGCGAGCLGGIVMLRPSFAASFDGWPMNFWGWGFEDLEAGRRALVTGGRPIVPTAGNWYGTTAFPADKKDFMKKGASPSAEANWIRFRNPHSQGGFGQTETLVDVSRIDTDHLIAQPRNDFGSQARGITGVCPPSDGNNSFDIFLTFDDGPMFDGIEWDSIKPTGAVTRDIELRFLQELDALDVKVTVFFLGSRAEAHPDVVQEYATRGHTICLHGYDHLNLNELSFEDGKKEIQKGYDALSNVLGRPVTCYRPAYLNLPDPLRVFAMMELQLHIVGVSADPEDWAYSPTTACHPKCTRTGPMPDLGAWLHEQVKRNGEVVLMHDRPETFAALPDALAKAKKACPACRFRGLSGNFRKCQPYKQWQQPPCSALTDAPSDPTAWPCLLN